MADPLRLEYLGGWHASLGDTPVTGFVSGKVPALLCYLAMTGRPQTRSTLATLFWGESPEADAANNLRQALSNLRRLLDPWLVITRQTVALDADSPICLDVARFEAVITTGLAEDDLEQLRAATALYRGDFLDGFSVRDAPEFDNWVMLERERLRDLALRALHRLAIVHATLGESTDAIVYTTRLLALDPWREDAHRHLMLLLARAGQRGAALAQYAICQRVLADELGVEPLPETTALFERIRSAATSRAAPPPPPSTPFVGREEERAVLARRLADPDCRLITVVGPGGIGKTRLALQAAQDTAPRLLHGAAVVPLAAVSAPDLLVSTIASELNLSFRGGEDPQTQLFNYLREKELLLVLDNFEQLIEDGTGLLVDLLRNAPDVRLLVTSRERLRLQGEWLLELDGLRVPTDACAGEAASYSAVQLFLQRAQQVRSGFTLAHADKDDEEVQALVRVCRLVEGLPLGIELAAAWTPVLSCREIAHEIEQSLRFLQTSLRDVPERHRSLRAVVDHSWQALSADERDVLGRMSVFRGGFDRVAAEQVAGASLPILSALVSKSLLRGNVQPAGRQRFELHEFIRQYAAEQLSLLPGALELAQHRHAAQYGSFLRQQAQRLAGPEQHEALSAIGTEIDNVREGWRYAVARRDVALLGDSLGSLAAFYDIRGWFHEGEEVCGQAAAALAGSDTAGDDATRVILGRLLARQGMLSFRLSRYERAGELLDRGLELARALGDTGGIVFALNALATLAWARGRYAEASRYGEESLALAHSLGDTPAAASTLNILGNVAFQRGEYAESQQRHQAALAIRRADDDRRGIAISLNNLGNTAWAWGEYQEAARLYGASLTILREVGDRYGIATMGLNLADIARVTGDYALAQDRLRESLALCREMGERQGMARTLYILGGVESTLGDPAKAQLNYEESLLIYREIDNLEGIAMALTHLGRVAGVRGDPQTAQRHLREGLEIALTIQALPVALLAIVEQAGLLVLVHDDAATDQERAVEHLTFALGQPASEQETRDRATGLLRELEARLAPDQFTAARERGQAGTLETIIEQGMSQAQ